ncbi:hypothetical protein BDW22DRAFT_11521 [Trametopsis cervina]|nr:hypothetical protein BDW22DRAFT_11521 [Trametopsis cervina]
MDQPHASRLTSLNDDVILYICVALQENVVSEMSAVFNMQTPQSPLRPPSLPDDRSTVRMEEGHMDPRTREAGELGPSDGEICSHSDRHPLSRTHNGISVLPRVTARQARRPPPVNHASRYADRSHRRQPCPAFRRRVRTATPRVPRRAPPRARPVERSPTVPSVKTRRLSGGRPPAL